MDTMRSEQTCQFKYVQYVNMGCPKMQRNSPGCSDAERCVVQMCESAISLSVSYYNWHLPPFHPSPSLFIYFI